MSKKKNLTNVDLLKLHYKFDNESNPTKSIQKELLNTKYTLVKANRGVAHFKDTETNANYISVRGTNPSKKKDLISDIKLALGMSSTDKQFTKRTNAIKDIYRNNTGDNHLIGHSLGGSVIQHALTKSPSILNKTKSANTYNIGMTNAFHKDTYEKLDKKSKKKFNNKVVHHRIKGDLISKSLLNDGFGGVVYDYESDSINPLKNHSLDNFF